MVAAASGWDGGTMLSNIFMAAWRNSGASASGRNAAAVRRSEVSDMPRLYNQARRWSRSIRRPKTARHKTQDARLQDARLQDARHKRRADALPPKTPQSTGFSTFYLSPSNEFLDEVADRRLSVRTSHSFIRQFPDQSPFLDKSSLDRALTSSIESFWRRSPSTL